MKKRTIINFIALMAITSIVNGQATVTPNTWNLQTDFLGWDVTPGSPDLFIKHELNRPIRFYTNAGNGTFLNQRMIIDADPGHIGIGLNHLPGNDVLDILPDVNFPNTGIGINNETVLHNWGTGNIFTGIGAGFNNDPTPSNGGIENAFFGHEAGFFNRIGGDNVFVGFRAGYTNEVSGRLTFVGWKAGYSNTSGDQNTFVGAEAGRENTTGNDNTFIGDHSGESNTTGYYNLFAGANSGSNNTKGYFNVFLGHTAGLYNISGNMNVYVGMRAGEQAEADRNTCLGFMSGIGSVNNYTGYENTFVGNLSGFSINSGRYNCFTGSESGLSNTRGENNTFMGYQSGATNVDGSLNTFIGSGSGSATAVSLNNSAAIGAGATVLNNNKMILGNNEVNVGIGLSNVPGGPLRKLHIQDDAAPQLRLSHTYNATVASGIWTDFQTTAAGNLFINPRNAGVNRFVGINTNTPGNTLEINSNAANATAGTSGLRFTDLNSTSTGVGAITRALTVDGNGDVVLGDLPGGGGSVSACASPGLNLTNYITKITGNNEICRTQGIYEDNNSPFATGIGITPSSIPSIANSPSKLQVNGNVLITSRSSYNAYNAINIERRLLGIYGGNNQELTLAVGPLAGNNNNSTSQCVFVGFAAGLNTSQALQSTFIGCEAGTNYVTSPFGANTFTGFRSGANITGNNYNSFYGAYSGSTLNNGNENAFFGANAGNGFTDGSRNTYIGRLAGTNFNGDDNVFLGYFSGVTWGPQSIQNRMALGSHTQSQCDDCAILGNLNQYVGIGEYHPAPSTWNNFNGCRLVVQPIAGSNNAAFFNGNIFATQLNPSDSIIKNNISVYPNSSAVIDAIEVYSYNFNANACPQLNLPQGNQVGFISQQVENIVPGLVNSFTIPAVYDSSGNTQHPEFTFKALNYAGVVPYLVSALKEFKSRLDSLQQQLNSCCNLRIPAPENTGSIELENIRSLQLFAADPNPFSESTLIRWSLPDEFANAVIYFYDDKGNRINQHVITEKGDGRLQVFGSKLSSGVYSYTLVVDNRIVETRRMVKMK